MDAHLITRLDTLLRSGQELAPEGGSEFSGYNAKKQGTYLLWRKNCIDALNALEGRGAEFSARVSKAEDGLYFYHSSAQHIVSVMEEALGVARAIAEAEERARAEALAREEAAREQARREAEAREQARREEEARKEAEERARREAEERKQAEERARIEEAARQEAEERARREEQARKETEERERQRREEEERRQADERERQKREAEAREQEARETARKQVEALEAERAQEEAEKARQEAKIAETRAKAEPASSPVAPYAPASAAGAPKVLLYSLSNHVLLKQVQKFFDELSLEYTVITHTDGVWSGLRPLDSGAAHVAVFLLSNKYQGQELMALGYLAGSSPSVRLCAIHAQTLALGDLLPGVTKLVFAASFDEVKPKLETELKAAGCAIAR